MTPDSQYVVLEGRRWVVSDSALADLAEHKSWKNWADRPTDEPATYFGCVRGAVFVRQLDLKEALLAGGASGAPTDVVDALLHVTFECPPSVLTPGDPNVVLYRTDNGGRLHLPDCTHVRGVDIIAASQAERDSIPVCVLSQNELDGVGRTRFEAIEEGLEDIHAPGHARAELARLLNEVDWDGVYTPNSKSYVAVTRGARIVASAGKTFVYYPGRPLVYLDDYLWSAGGGAAVQAPLHGDKCPKHPWYERSVTGACPECD